MPALLPWPQQARSLYAGQLRQAISTSVCHLYRFATSSGVPSSSLDWGFLMSSLAASAKPGQSWLVVPANRSVLTHSIW